MIDSMDGSFARTVSAARDAIDVAERQIADQGRRITVNLKVMMALKGLEQVFETMESVMVEDNGVPPVNTSGYTPGSVLGRQMDQYL